MGIDGGGRIADLAGSPTGNRLITVESGVTLTLKNITLKGLSVADGDSASNTAQVIKVVDGGALELKAGAVIERNDALVATSTHGVGVSVPGTGASLTMYEGSEVRFNKGHESSGGSFGIVATSLDSAVGAARILELYRMRWAIELVFKRLKTLLRCNEIPSKLEAAARAWFYGKLPLAAICEAVVNSGRFSPCGEQNARERMEFLEGT